MMKCYVALMLTALVANVYIGDSEAARILGLFSLNGKSHFVMFEALLKGLAARGHQVYVVGHFPQKKPVPNYTDISVEGSLPTIDLETFINGAKDGVIYFCLGSLVRAETLPKDKLEAFISVFSELPQRVIWKIDNITGLPNNVKASKWFPQFDILSHPNVRVFVTHGGLMGTQEAVHTGVPMVGIPLFADQELNIRNYVSRGIAVMVLYDHVTKESISNALKTVLHDPSYRKNAKQLSRLFRDRPQTPLETAMFWTEYVIRHKGATHMRSAAVDLSWYQYLLLDVAAVVATFAAIMIWVMYALFKILIGICSKSVPKKLKSR